VLKIQVRSDMNHGGFMMVDSPGMIDSPGQALTLILTLNVILNVTLTAKSVSQHQSEPSP